MGLNLKETKNGLIPSYSSAGQRQERSFLGSGIIVSSRSFSFGSVDFLEYNAKASKKFQEPFNYQFVDLDAARVAQDYRHFYWYYYESPRAILILYVGLSSQFANIILSCATACFK